MMFFCKKSVLWSFSGLIIIIVPAVFFSCYPGDTLTPADTDIISTFYKSDFDFSSKTTFAMPDTLIQVARDDAEPADISHQYDQIILDRIAQNLVNLGYTRVDDPAEADVHVLPFVSSSTWVTGGCYWYWGYWYGYSGYCYPVAYSYTTGSLVIAMSDPDNTEDTTVLWLAGINGLMSGSTAVDFNARINQNIDQAFMQSPYLGEGK